MADINKMMDPNVAAKAYGQTSNIADRRSSGGDDGVTFSDFLENAARDSLDTMKQGERMSAKAVTGEADLTDVVQAVNAAELTLETVVAVRDRLISSFQEILRMPM